MAKDGRIIVAGGGPVGLIVGLILGRAGVDVTVFDKGDIVVSRQAEDTFKTFREAGRALGIARLQQLGDLGERDHDDYHREANRLAQQMFVEHVREGDTTGLNISQSAATAFGAAGTSTSSSSSI